jgi:benzoyl-CoA reductase/2-hydroxyglutaryl-CoA dehydratase subunit BcrC/BadD/HgdB
MKKYNTKMSDIKKVLGENVVASLKDARKNRRLRNNVANLIVKRMQNDPNSLTAEEMIASLKTIIDIDKDNLESFAEGLKLLEMCENLEAQNRLCHQ